MSPTENVTAISIKLSSEWIEKLDKLATKAEISRHQLLKNMTEVGLDQIRKYDRVGFLQVGIMLRDLLSSNKPKPADTGKGERAIPVYLRDDLVEKIDLYAEKAKLNRQQLLRNLIKVGIDELEMLAALGIVDTVLLVEKLKGKFKSLIKDGEDACQFMKDKDSYPV